MTALERSVIQVVLTAILASLAVAAMFMNWPWVVGAAVALIVLALSNPFRQS